MCSLVAPEDIPVHLLALSGPMLPPFSALHGCTQGAGGVSGARAGAGAGARSGSAAGAAGAGSGHSSDTLADTLPPRPLPFPSDPPPHPPPLGPADPKVLLRCSEVVAALKRYSLATTGGEGEADSDASYLPSFNLHRLLQTSVRDVMPEADLRRYLLVVAKSIMEGEKMYWKDRDEDWARAVNATAQWCHFLPRRARRKLGQGAGAHRPRRAVAPGRCICEHGRLHGRAPGGTGKPR